MQYQDFRTQLASFVQRKDISNSQLDFFVNGAKNELQLERDFNFTRKTASLTYPSTLGVGVALPTDYKGLVGQYAVSVGVNGLNNPIKGETFEQRQRRQQQRYPYPSGWNDSSIQTFPPVCKTGLNYRVEWLSGAPFLLLYPEVASAALQVWYFSWIPDYGSNLTLEDFLLKYSPMLLLWESLKIQNRYVKEEFRISIDEAAYQASLNRLIEYDSRIPISGAMMDLS